jgi:outer membrane protein OmpA-like peptidoglycan-associated protein
MKKGFINLVGAASAVCVLSNCTTIDPYTGEQKTSHATQNAAIGAVAGGILGAVIGNNTGDGDAATGALIGAAAGGLAGAGIGHYMDQQEAAIRQQLQGTGVSVTRVGNDLVLNMPSDITFKTNQSSIQPRFSSTLQSVALVLKKYDRTRISVSGHTDSDGSDSYNMQLSQARAQAVANNLYKRGVSGSRIQSYGYGEKRPVASNNSSAGKAKNRRVELRIVPQQSQF